MNKDDEIVTEIRKSIVVLELLSNSRLIDVRRDLLLEEAATLMDPLLLGLPEGCHHSHHHHGSSATVD